MWATVGLHPHDAGNGVDVDRRRCSTEPEVVAVGECGLDYHYDHSPREVQREAFAAQVALAHERGLPLVIHTREAWDDTFAVLAAEGVPRAHRLPLLHRRRRRGPPVPRPRCVPVASSGIVTFKTADDVRAAAALCPPTGSSSRPTRPTSRRSPTGASATSRPSCRSWRARVAEVRGVNVSQIEHDTEVNARVAFRLTQS